MKKVITIIITMLLTAAVFTACAPGSAALLEDTGAFAEELYNNLSPAAKTTLSNGKSSITVSLNKDGKLTVEATTFEPFMIPVAAEGICPLIKNALERYSNVNSVSVRIGDSDYEAVWVSEDGEKGTLNRTNKSNDLVVPEINSTVEDLKDYYKADLDKFYGTESPSN
ncbi:MAG: hypothetical protein IJ168_10330 [Eubacterium sp.]|nr:hypothetical protein [Eubacterium sp.]